MAYKEIESNGEGVIGEDIFVIMDYNKKNLMISNKGNLCAFDVKNGIIEGADEDIRICTTNYIYSIIKRLGVDVKETEGKIWHPTHTEAIKYKLIGKDFLDFEFILVRNEHYLIIANSDGQIRSNIKNNLVILKEKTFVSIGIDYGKACSETIKLGLKISKENRL